MTNFFSFILFVIMLCISSCTESGSKNGKGDSASKLKIEIYLDSIQAKFPRSDSNTAIKEEMNDYLKTDFKARFNDGLMNDLPFALEKVEKCDKKYIAVFEHSLNTKYYKTGMLDKIEMDLYCQTDEQTAKKLVEKEFYLINGKFKDYINFQNNEKYCALVLMSPFQGFSNGILGEEVQFGAIGIKLDSIQRFAGK